ARPAFVRHVRRGASRPGRGIPLAGARVDRAGNGAAGGGWGPAGAGCRRRLKDPPGAERWPAGRARARGRLRAPRGVLESDSSELTSHSIATLEKQAQWLQVYNQYTFTIEGHADERGTREYNIALGARRAQTVRDYLASRGVHSQRMRTISYGKERPV